MGEESHGVSRYSRIVARGVSAAGGDVQEHHLPDQPSLLLLARTALGARGADVVHVQFAKQYWGGGRGQFWAVLVLRAALVGQPLVVTAHDFHTARTRSPRAGWLRWLPRRLPADDAASRLLLGTADLVLTCSQAEADVLAWTRPRRSAVIDHFVEERHAVETCEPPSHRREDLLVLGYIHRRKGQLRAVRALQHLPDEHLVIAGTANERNGHYVEEIKAEAEATGVVERLHMTGYLAEPELDDVLAHARVGLAPYEKIAASGSLATLAAAGVPIVARRHAYLDEMALACPQGVRLYDGEDDGALADTIRDCMARPLDVQRAELLDWAAQHSPVKTGRRHLEQYSSIVTRGSAHLDRGGGSVSAGATICGFYGRNNLGDEAILGGMVDLLAHARPGEPPLAMSDDPSSSRSAHGIDAVSTRAPSGMRRLAGLHMTRAVVSRRDFILGGGDLLRDSSRQDVVGPWLSHLERAQRLRRRSAVVGISVGRLWRPTSLERIRSSFEKVSFVITRDEPSAARLREIGVQTKVTVGPDLALRLFPRRDPVASAVGGKRVVVCVRGLADRADEGSTAAHEHAVGELAATLDVLSADGVEVHLVPLRSMSGRLQPVDDDYVAGLELAHHARRGHTFTVHRHVPDVTALRDLLTTADLVIGMRLHSIIMAAGLGVPALALAYDQKVSQFCAEVGLDGCSPLGSTDRLVLTAQARERLSDGWDTSEQPRLAEYRARAVPVEERLRSW